jgi:hypothetical protein
MVGIYNPGGPSATAANSNDVANESTVPGSTVTDALDTLNSGVITKYIPTAPITLTGTDIANKYIVLPAAPTDKDKTQCTVIGGIMAVYGDDFLVTNDNGGQRFSWDGLTLETLLAEGDQLIITFN